MRINSPLALLLLTGLALGINFPLGKLATGFGIDPLLWAAFICAGAGLIMTLLQWLTGSRRHAGAPLLRYSLISGFVSYVVPNGLTFFLIPKIGSGLAAIMFALSPVFTALLSLLLRVRPPSALGLAGIALGLVGALVIVFGKGGVTASTGQGWVMLALLVPLFLGLGNVYRTLAWPAGAEGRTLAATTNLAAVLPLLALAVARNGALPIDTLVAHPLLALSQLCASTLMFLTFFKLQQVGGPTYLSQIGYVAAAVGLFFGVGFLGESYAGVVWVGAAVIAAGVALSTLGQRRA